MLYKKLGIRYRTVDAHMTNKISKAEYIRSEQKLFVARIEQHWKGTKKCYFFDEASIHCWMKTTKAFSGVAEPTFVPMQPARNKGLTVMGALDMCSLD